MDKKKVISTLTNIAYGIAGAVQWLVSALLAAPSCYLILLMAGSGYHHYYLKSWSRKYDYMAMYGALSSSIVFGLIGASFWTFILPLILTGILYLFYKSSRVVITVLIGVLLIVVAVIAHPVYALALASFAALPFTFNMLGDSLEKHYDPLHGVGWHVPTAGALMATNLILLFARQGILPLV